MTLYVWQLILLLVVLTILAVWIGDVIGTFAGRLFRDWRESRRRYEAAKREIGRGVRKTHPRIFRGDEEAS